MHLFSMLASAFALLSSAIASTSYRDPDTGLTFASDQVSYKVNQYITFRFAVPSSVPSFSGFDTVIQVVAPNEIGWVGIAWNNRMVYGPLTVAWNNGNSAVVSSRWTTSYSAPSYDTAHSQLQLISSGTKRSGTHWQYTAKCSGCTSFISQNNWNVTLSANGSNRLAFAWSPQKPASTSPSGTINPHNGFGYFNSDFSQGQNANLE
ncbi:CBD9-like protein [Lojkania enalia]|uniref:CBD9-like protein n=1 Tax=Lojkania enalia TaxID=147567 RepID=A0A9P4JYT2_9PLEO|nr:CBD9-like protein [Didymosphaeria enalia]